MTESDNHIALQRYILILRMKDTNVEKVNIEG